MLEVKTDTKGQKKVVALSHIPKGSSLLTFTGEVIDYTETLKLGNKESFALQIAKDYYIYLNPPCRFFNHSCEPNCGLSPARELRALKDISKGEELRYDYSTTMLEHHWTMKCNCGAKTCRKVVRDFTTLPKTLQEKYIELGIVQDFIVQEIKDKSML